MMLLVPCDVLNPRRVDDHFSAEADAARAAGHRVGLVDHDALAAGDTGRIARLTGADEAVYRGWMLTADAYSGFAAALSEQGIVLRTGADQYRRGHELPGWYAALETFTPTTAWTTGSGQPAFDTARTELGGGPAVLRDYTKSMKHHWHDAAYIPDLADAEAAWRVARRFLELRDTDFTGGFVLRRFETFTGPEVRTWWVNGICQLVTAHPDTPDQVPAEDLVLPSRLDSAITGLGLPFVTVDLAQRDDGVWRVIELGDGQVSDRPAGMAPEAFIAAVLPV